MNTLAPMKDDVVKMTNDSNFNETCKNEIEVLLSKTVLRIIEIIEKYNPEKKNTSEKPEKPISLIYSRFAKGYPLSEKNIYRLIQFFENPKNQELAKEIISKIDIKEGNNNSNFIRRFLKSSNSLEVSENVYNITRASLGEERDKIIHVIKSLLDGIVYENDPTNLINHVIDKLKNYPYKANFDFELNHELEKKYPPYKLFVFKRNGKKGFMVRGENNLEDTEAIYSNIVYLKNGTYLGVKKENVKGASSNRFQGDILTFNNGKIDNLGTIDNLIDTPVLDNLNLFFTIEGNKVGYKEIEKREDGKVLLDKLPANYNKIEIINGITFASINLDSGKKNLEVYTKNGNKETFEDIDLYSYIDPNMVKITKNGLISYFKVEENGDILPIDFIQNINSLFYPKNIESFLLNHGKSKPVFIKNNNGEICLVGPDGNKTILEIKNVNRINSSVEQDSIKFKIGNKTYYFNEESKELYILNTPKTKKIK